MYSTFSANTKIIKNITKIDYLKNRTWIFHEITKDYNSQVTIFLADATFQIIKFHYIKVNSLAAIEAIELFFK